MIRAAALCCAVAGLVVAEWNPAEQAQRGRDAWRAAVTALRGGDSLAALAQLRIAHEAWPAQPTYSETLVRLAARLDDATTASSTLQLLASQGLGATAASDSVVTALAARHEPLARARRDVLRASAGPVTSTTEVVHADSTFFAEGLELDPRDGTRFITSLRHRNVWVLPTSGSGRWLLPQEQTGRAAVFGVKLAPDGQTLWLSLAPTPHMQAQAGDSTLVAELWQVDRRSGDTRRRVRLGDGRGIPGELTVHPDGSVLASDAVLGRLYRLRVDADSVEVIQSPLLRSPQGIALLSDGVTAIVADWSHGLLRWDLRRDSITAVETPNTMALLGIDGLLNVDGDLIAVQNGVRPMRVLRLTLTEDGRRLRTSETVDRPAEAAGEFTVAAAQGREVVYVASSAWPYWNDNGQRIPNSGALPSVTLRRFSLAPRRE